VSDTLYIAAKVPEAGLAKTRLGAAIGYEAAATLYGAFLRDLAERFLDGPYALNWYITPPDSWPRIAAILPPAGRCARVIAQGGGDWTERQRALFRDAAARGEDTVVLMASDSPQLPVAAVTAAVDQLDRHDVVLGPTLDGGYYLLGMRGWHDVLDGVQMSTDSVLDRIVARAHGLGLSVGRLASTFDIDTVDDLQHLWPLLDERTDLEATRAAMLAIGLRSVASRVASVRHPFAHPAALLSPRAGDE